MGGKVGKALKDVAETAVDTVGHVATVAVGTAIKIAPEAAAAALGINDGPLTSTDVETLQVRWGHMVSFARQTGVTIPTVTLPSTSGEVPAFLTNITQFEKDLQAVADAGMLFLADMRCKYPASASNQLYDSSRLSDVERETEAHFSAAADSIGLDASLDEHVQSLAAGRATGKTLEIGIDPTLGPAAATHVNSKPMESPHGLPAKAVPAVLAKQTAANQKPPASEVMGADGIHVLTVGVRFRAPDWGFVDWIKTDTLGHAVNTTFATGTTSVPIYAWIANGISYAGVVGDKLTKSSGPWPSVLPKGPNAGTPPVPTDVPRLSWGFGTPHSWNGAEDGAHFWSGYNQVYVPYVSRPPTTNAKFVWSAAGGATLTRGQGVVNAADPAAVDAWGHELTILDTAPNGNQKILEPGNADFSSDGTVLASMRVSVDVKIEISVPAHMARTNGHTTYCALWISEMDTHNCELVTLICDHTDESITVPMRGHTATPDVVGTRRLQHHMRLVAGRWLLTAWLYTLKDYERETQTTSGPTANVQRDCAMIAMADSIMMDGSLGQVSSAGGEGPFMSVETSIVTTERAGEPAVAEMIGRILDLGGTTADDTVDSGLDVWYTPHFQHGGPNAATRNFKLAAPSDHMAMIRAAVTDGLKNRGVEFEQVCKTWSNWTNDDSWCDLDWEFIHPASVTQFLAAPQATATATGWDHALTRTRNFLATTVDAAALAADDTGRQAMFEDLRYVMGPSFNLSALVKKIGFGTSVLDAQQIFMIRCSDVMISKRAYQQIKDHSGIIASTGISATVPSSEVGKAVASQLVGN